MTTFRGSFTFLTFKYGLRFENRWHQRVEFSWENLLTKAMNLSWNSEGRLNGCWFQACSQLSAADWESSLCLPTTWWVFLGHIRQQHRIPTTLSLMASTKMNRAVSRKCYYQGFFFFNVKTGLPSTRMTGSQSMYTLSYCSTGEVTTHPAKGHHVMWIVKARDQPCSVSKSVL